MKSAKELTRIREILMIEIMKATTPALMTKSEALEVYEGIVDDLQMAIEALEEEIKEGGG